MRKNWWVLLVGLVVFTAVYAIYFPQSQKPLRLSVDAIWRARWPAETALASARPFIATEKAVYKIDGDTIQRIDYPVQPELPQGLSWGKPNILSMSVYDGEPVLQLKNGFLRYSKGQWTPFEQTEDVGISDGWEITDGTVTIDGESGIVIGKPDSGFIEKIEKEKIFFQIQGKKFEVADDRNSQNKVFSPPMSDDGKLRGVVVGKNTFMPTKDGRISITVGGKETGIIDRANLGLDIVPAKIASDGETIYVMTRAIYGSSPSFWVQAYDTKEFKWKGELVASSGSKPVSIGFCSGMIVVLFDDGLLSFYNKEGFSLFSEKVCDSPLDMISVGETTYVLSPDSLLSIAVTQKSAQNRIWPRMVDLGNVAGEARFKVGVEIKDAPNLVIKGDFVKLDSIEKKEGYYAINLVAKTNGLISFEEYEVDIIIESGIFREIVPVKMVASPKTTKLEVFEGVAIDVGAGKSYKAEIEGETLKLDMELPESGEIIYDPLTSSAFVLDTKRGLRL
ncbi:MAG: hypothetical protein GX421_05705 [Caldisericales bacterium]|nr:hypothetical protein [Caldisericales bacterium]